MLFALITVHLVTDFALQPDWMASGKRRSTGILALHAALSAAGIASLGWLIGAPLALVAPVLGLIHFGVDWGKIRLEPHLRLPIVASFLLDQAVHLASIVAVLGAFGLLAAPAPSGTAWQLLVLALVYTVSVFFGYVLLKILTLQLKAETASLWSGKYFGMLERGLITTLVGLGLAVPAAGVMLAHVLAGAYPRPTARLRRRWMLEMLVNFLLGIGCGVGYAWLSR